MQALLQELEMIEKEYAAFFEMRKLKLFQVTLKPSALRHYALGCQSIGVSCVGFYNF